MRQHRAGDEAGEHAGTMTGEAVQPIVGALALGSSNAVLLADLIEMRRASTAEQVRQGIRLARRTSRLFPLAALLLLAPADYLVASAWAWATPRIVGALGAGLVPPLLERAVIEPRLAALDAGLPQAPAIRSPPADSAGRPIPCCGAPSG